MGGATNAEFLEMVDMPSEDSFLESYLPMKK